MTKQICTKYLFGHCKYKKCYYRHVKPYITKPIECVNIVYYSAYKRYDKQKDVIVKIYTYDYYHFMECDTYDKSFCTLHRNDWSKKIKKNIMLQRDSYLQLYKIRFLSYYLPFDVVNMIKKLMCVAHIETYIQYNCISGN